MATSSESQWEPKISSLQMDRGNPSGVMLMAICCGVITGKGSRTRTETPNTPGCLDWAPEKRQEQKKGRYNNNSRTQSYENSFVKNFTTSSWWLAGRIIVLGPDWSWRMEGGPEMSALMSYESLLNVFRWHHHTRDKFWVTACSRLNSATKILTVKWFSYVINFISVR